MIFITKISLMDDRWRWLGYAIRLKILF